MPFIFDNKINGLCDFFVDKGRQEMQVWWKLPPHRGVFACLWMERAVWALGQK